MVDVIMSISCHDDMYIEGRDGFFKIGWDWMDIPYRQFEYFYQAPGRAVLAITKEECDMGWGSLNSQQKSFAKIEIIDDGIYSVDARIYFGKYCPDRDVGVLLSDIAAQEKGRGYIKWLMDSFEGVHPDQDDDFRNACQEVLDSSRR